MEQLECTGSPLEEHKIYMYAYIYFLFFLHSFKFFFSSRQARLCLVEVHILYVLVQ